MLRWASIRAISRSRSRCLILASRIALSALAISSPTAAKAARHSVSGRASPFSPRSFGEDSAKLSANLRRAVADSIAPSSAASRHAKIRCFLSISGILPQVEAAAAARRQRRSPDRRRPRLRPAATTDQASAESPWRAASIAGRQIETDQPRDRCAVRIDRDGIDLRVRIELGRHGRHGRDDGGDGNKRKQLRRMALPPTVKYRGKEQV